ncbi:MAG TPA: hypothetical protein PLO34_03030 [Pseudoxanthomonas sp.]|nr:hypothetical protein [Pseudoxanthomonas sp.]
MSAVLLLMLASTPAGCGGARNPALAASAPATPAGTGFVSSAHPLATEAGLEVLRRGGSAIDAGSCAFAAPKARKLSCPVAA